MKQSHKFLVTLGLLLLMSLLQLHNRLRSHLQTAEIEMNHY